MFWKIIKVYNLFQNLNIIKHFHKLIKPLPKKFLWTLSKFVKVYNSLSKLYLNKVNDCDLIKKF